MPSYAQQVAPIFAERCNTCHNPADPSGPWPLDTPQDINDWLPLILDDLRACTMPPAESGVAFPEAERQLMNAWLVCGAPDN